MIQIRRTFGIKVFKNHFLPWIINARFQGIYLVINFHLETVFVFLVNLRKSLWYLWPWLKNILSVRTDLLFVAHLNQASKCTGKLSHFWSLGNCQRNCSTRIFYFCPDHIETWICYLVCKPQNKLLHLAQKLENFWTAR